MNERSIYSMIIFGIVIENIVPLSISELTSISNLEALSLRYYGLLLSPDLIEPCLRPVV